MKKIMTLALVFGVFSGGTGFASGVALTGCGLPIQQDTKYKISCCDTKSESISCDANFKVEITNEEPKINASCDSAGKPLSLKCATMPIIEPRKD